MPRRKKPVIKRGRARVISRASREKAPRDSQMAMDRPITPKVFSNREIATKVPSRDEKNAANAAKMREFHSTLKPLR